LAPDAYQGARSKRSIYCFRLKVASFVVLGKIVLVGFATGTRSANWHAMVPAGRRARCVAHCRSWLQSRRSLSDHVATAAAYRRRPCWLHTARTRRWRAGRIFRDFFYTLLTLLTLVGASVSSALVRHKTGGAIFANFSGYGWLPLLVDAWRSSCFVSWHTAAGRIFRKILLIQRCAAR